MQIPDRFHTEQICLRAPGRRHGRNETRRDHRLASITAPRRTQALPRIGTFIQGAHVEVTDRLAVRREEGGDPTLGAGAVVDQEGAVRRSEVTPTGHSSEQA